MLPSNKLAASTVPNIESDKAVLLKPLNAAETDRVACLVVISEPVIVSIHQAMSGNLEGLMFGHMLHLWTAADFVRGRKRRRKELTVTL